MTELIKTYKSELLYTLLVLVAVVLLLFLTHLINRWLIKQEQRLFPEAAARPFLLIKKILNTLWVVLGVMVLVFIFSDESYYQSLTRNFKLVLYLGLLSVLTIILATSTDIWFKHSIARKVSHKEDPTSFKFLRYVSVLLIYFIGILFFLLAFPSMRGVAQTALGGAGVLAIVIGIASQEALANVVGGIFIISFKPFKVGDIVKVTDTMVGTVTDITLRHTVIRNFENKMIVIPNSIINKEKLINYDLGEKKCCERIEIGISYDSNVRLAKRIMQEECENHPLIYDNRSTIEKKGREPLVRTALISLNEYSVTIRAWAWAKNFEDSFQLRIDVLESIKARFEEKGIEIPFPHRTLQWKENKHDKEGITLPQNEMGNETKDA